MFGQSGAGSLRQTLAGLGRTEHVVTPHDDFSFGPIASGDAARVAWVEDELGFSEWELEVSYSAPFLEASCSPEITPVAWISRRSAPTYAGFLWWLSHLGSAPCKVIDVTDLIVVGGPAKPDLRMRAISPSILSNADLARLLDTGVDLDPVSREAHHARWNQLVAENAPSASSTARALSSPLRSPNSILFSSLARPPSGARQRGSSATPSPV